MSPASERHGRVPSFQRYTTSSPKRMSTSLSLSLEGLVTWCLSPLSLSLSFWMSPIRMSLPRERDARKENGGGLPRAGCLRRARGTEECPARRSRRPSAHTQHTFRKYIIRTSHVHDSYVYCTHHTKNTTHVPKIILSLRVLVCVVMYNSE